MSDNNPVENSANLRPVTTDHTKDTVAFGSNEVRLTTAQWVSVALLVPAILAAIPSCWSRIEPLDAGPEYRIPYALSEDYWWYQRWVARAVSDEQIIVLGDSVIWGEYVTPGQTLPHYLGEQFGTMQFANGGLNGAHPLALSGLVQNYAVSLQGRRVVLHCNLLWMSSPERDLQVEKQVHFNHPDLVPQFVPRIPCYRANLADRMGVVLDRNLPFRKCVRHVKIATFQGQDVPHWTLEHPWSNPVRQAVRHSTPDQRDRPQAISWVERGIRPQDFAWVNLNSSLQWQAFESLVQCLTRRNDSVFVVVGPLNEHLLTPESLQRYHALVDQVDGWLNERGVDHAVPAVLPSSEYADASHPLAAGYARLAEQLAADPEFQRWLRPRE